MEAHDCMIFNVHLIFHIIIVLISFIFSFIWLPVGLQNMLTNLLNYVVVEQLQNCQIQSLKTEHDHAVRL